MFHKDISVILVFCPILARACDDYFVVSLQLFNGVLVVGGGCHLFHAARQIANIP